MFMQSKNQIFKRAYYDLANFLNKLKFKIIAINGNLITNINDYAFIDESNDSFCLRNKNTNKIIKFKKCEFHYNDIELDFLIKIKYNDLENGSLYYVLDIYPNESDLKESIHYGYRIEINNLNFKNILKLLDDISNEKEKIKSFLDANTFKEELYATYGIKHKDMWEVSKF